MTFQPVLSSSDVPKGGVRVVKRDGQQVAVFRLADGGLAAVDNRCPHEGYPLSAGTCSEGTLTCCYHNFKFDLATGACLKGDEAVRVVPVREEGGRIELDLTPPDPAVERERAFASLRSALVNARTGQCLRDLARLLQLGVPATELVGLLAADDGVRSEWGATHVLAVAADVCEVLPRFEGLRAVVPLALLVDLIVEAHPRRGPRPAAEPVAVGEGWQEALAQAVEAEDTERAEGLVRGALGAGGGRLELEVALMAPVAAHFLDFGHGAIYQSKVFDLLDTVGWHHAPDVLAGHVVGRVGGTREDDTPGWGRWRRTVDGVGEHFAAWRAQTGEAPGLAEALPELSGPQAVSAVIEAFQAGAGPQAVARALILGGAERMLRFDRAIEGRRDVQDNWLSVSHILTFTESLPKLLDGWDHPDAVRWLLMGARMVGHHRVLDGPRPDVPLISWDPAAFRTALAARDDRAIVLAGAGALEAPEALRDALVDHALDHPAVRPIVVAHAFKLALSAPAACAVTGDPRPAMAAVRMLVSPLQERRLRRAAEEAIALVGSGQVPKLLAP